ncbi:MAG: FtsX-like permease family protein [Planctomycetes bacterium]|nr:FtsX-like permease family protein [Planctomycetota bacterium]
MRLVSGIAFALRETRGAGGRLVFFTASLALGVAAITGVAALVGAIEDGIRSRAQELLGADVAIESRRALPDELDGRIAELAGARRTDVVELATMARAEDTGRSRLVELAAVGPGYPLYGAVVLDPPGTLDDLGPERVAVAAELLSGLGVGIGERVRIGNASYAIAAVVLDEPGRLGVSFRSGPRVFTTLPGLERAQLTGFGSRVRNRALVRAPEGLSRAAVDAFAATLEETLPGAAYLRVETASESQPRIRRSLERVERYLALAALLSLVLGGVGVAQIVRAWVAARTQAVAVLRAIGFRPREVLVLFAGHVAILAFGASLVGSFAGTFLPFFVASAAPGLLPASFELAWEPWAILRGALLGVLIALAFAVPPLSAVWRVSPARVLRADAEPLPPPRAVALGSIAFVALGVLLAAWFQSRSLGLAAAFTGGVAGASLLLGLGARSLTRLATRVPRERLRPWLVHGIAALARPGAGTLGAVVALGLAVLSVTTVALVERRLVERLRSDLPTDAPSLFLLDVQADQRADVEALLARHGARNARSVPVVTARLAAIDGVDVARLAAGTPDDDLGRPRWVLTREQRITWGELSPDNEIVEGALWSDPARAEVSLEAEFARDLGARVGTLLSFDVQGVPVDLAVTSIRTVQWDSFAINFFLVAEPGALDDAPHGLLTAARVDAAAEQPFQDELARIAPNATVIRVREILDKVVDVLEKLGVGVRLLGGFTVAVGFAILAGVASAAALHRAREVALLKALGVSRASIAGLFATEFGLLGAVAGLVGGLAATVFAWQFLGRATDLGGVFSWWAPLVAAAGTGVLAAACGLLASAQALAARPIETLRG